MQIINLKYCIFKENNYLCNTSILATTLGSHTRKDIRKNLIHWFLSEIQQSGVRLPLLPQEIMNAFLDS